MATVQESLASSTLTSSQRHRLMFDHYIVAPNKQVNKNRSVIRVFEDLSILKSINQEFHFKSVYEVIVNNRENFLHCRLINKVILDLHVLAPQSMFTSTNSLRPFKNRFRDSTHSTVQANLTVAQSVHPMIGFVHVCTLFRTETH